MEVNDPPKSRVIRYNPVYRLGKKGFTVISREKTVVAEYLFSPLEVRRIRRLVNGYDFNVQFKMK